MLSKDNHSVNQVTPKLFQIADNPVKMHARSRSDSKYNQRGWQLTKAKNLKKMAEQIIERGVIKPEGLSESLAGVGHKTAGVVMSQAFGLPAFPVDTIFTD